MDLSQIVLPWWFWVGMADAVAMWVLSRILFR